MSCRPVLDRGAAEGVRAEGRKTHAHRFARRGCRCCLVCSWQAAAQNVGVADLQDYTLRNGQDLADLCGAEPGDELYAEAKQFCYGFLSGVVHFHDALATGPNGHRIVCPEGQVTRQDGAAIVAAWATAHPDQASTTDPAEAVVKAALDKWGPCRQ